MSVCKDLLAPGIAAFEKLTNAGRLCELAEFDDDLKALCQSGAQSVGAALLLPVHIKILCMVLCCCNLNPNIGKDDRNLRQSCVRETLDEVDALMDGKSRLKAEVSYNMRARPPEPLMDKDASDNLTTRPLRLDPYGRVYNRMLGRMNRDYPGVAPVGGRETRRPDVVIVRDPTQPPTKSNLVRVVEMKFPRDPYKQDQRLAYDRIDPTRVAKVLDVEECCKERRRQTEEAIKLTSAADELVKAQPSVWEQVGWGVVGVGLGAAAIALFFFPGEGPVGEVAAGTGAAEAMTMAGGRVLMSEGIRTAARLAAARRYSQVLGGALR
ncbi:MAG TPA: VRR-NUC domain-containing protein [Longimicrobiaceae bacterium]|nr:VRR-NUC domain-containing protein [Longimicrobiaceae bacterium]